MKRLLLLALTAGLLSPVAAEAFWKYGSKYEAKKACEAWSAKSPTYTYKWIYKTSWYEFENGETSGQKTIFDGKKFLYGERVEKEENKSRKAGLRECWHEKDTKQFLGMQNQILKGGEIYTRSEAIEIAVGSNMKLVKRFKY